MKNKGMITAICVILLLGIVITTTTFHVIDRQTATDKLIDSETINNKSTDSEFVKSEFLGTMYSKKMPANESVAGTISTDEVYGSENTFLNGSPDIVSPVGSVNDTLADDDTKMSGKESNYTLEELKERLDDIDATIKKMENSTAANTTDGMRDAAAYKYRLWDTELNQIYQSIMNVLSDKDADELQVRERRWIHKRDEAAKNASKKYKGGSMESVEYTSSLAQSTKERAYELLELYGSYLSERE